MLQPNRTKYRRTHRMRSALHGVSKGGNSISFGQYALKAITPAELTSRQTEAARKTVMGSLQREGKLFIRVFPQKSITKKAAEVPMGSGKGSPDHFVAVIQPGRIIFELVGVSEEKARRAFHLAAQKLPFKCKFVTKEL